MILRELGASLQRQGRASRQDLARQFEASEEVIEAMLGVWMRKGRVRKRQSAGCSGRCCTQREEVYFEWLPLGSIGLVQQG